MPVFHTELSVYHSILLSNVLAAEIIIITSLDNTKEVKYFTSLDNTKEVDNTQAYENTGKNLLLRWSWVRGDLKKLKHLKI